MPSQLSSYDLFVIGGGSGGIACARRAAAHGARVAVAEGRRWGGTCVNVGCVPKKIMWWASQVREFIEECHHYGELDATIRNAAREVSFQSGYTLGTADFSWSELKRRRDAGVERLNSLYARNLEASHVDQYANEAFFTGSRDPEDFHVIEMSNGQQVRAKHVLIATGGRPAKMNLPGEEFTINSDGFFELEQLPKKVAVVGAGYIAVELAEILNGLKAETHLFCRGQYVLRKFDDFISRHVTADFVKAGGYLHPGSNLKCFEKDEDGLQSIILNDGSRHDGFEIIIIATGRVPEIEKLGLDNVGVITTNSNHIEVNEYQETNVQGIFALGDVCGKVELTPMAIAAGRRLADRLFLSNIEFSEARANYSNVPTVVFSHPPAGVCGLTEAEARVQFGDSNIITYESTSVNLYYNVFDVPVADKPKIRIKLVCVLPSEKLVGFHMIGMGVDEMAQGFAVVLNMGGTKADLDRCIAIHPTAAEEVVTCHPWGLPHPDNKERKILSKFGV